MKTEITKFMEHFYILDDGRVRQFLITGEDEALLIDAGFEDSHVHEAVKEVTDLPVKVILTHGDMDHTGGLKDFGEGYLHEADWHLVKENGVCLHPLREGDVFSCGGYDLEVIEIPGHTYGSVAFFDREKRLLLPGDSVQKDGPIFMFGSHRNMNLYIASLEKLNRLADLVDRILPCHNDYPVSPVYIQRNMEDALAVKEGRLERSRHSVMPCDAVKGRWTEFYCDRIQEV